MLSVIADGKVVSFLAKINTACDLSTLYNYNTSHILFLTLNDISSSVTLSFVSFSLIFTKSVKYMGIENTFLLFNFKKGKY